MNLSETLREREGFNASNGQRPRVFLFERLEREGRWKEASAWRKAREASIPGDGVDQSWLDMLDQFPADATLEPVEAVAWTPHHEGRRKDRSGDYAAAAIPHEKPKTDLEWVYHNMTNPEPDVATAPSPGAWSLLQWASENRKEFYRLYAPKVIGQKAEKESEAVKNEKRTVRERLEMRDVFMKDYQKKKSQVHGETEPGAPPSEPGKPTQKNIPTITLLHAR